MGSDYFQEVDNDAVFRNVADFTHTITNADQVPRVINRAIEMALNGGEVSVLSLPGDVGSLTGDADAAGPSITVPSVASAPDPGIVSRLAELLSASKKTTILAGLGSRGARAELTDLAAHLNAPIVATLKAKEFLDWDNPFNVGQSGLLGNRTAADALHDADLLLMVGTDFPYREYYPTSATVIQIDDAAAHIGRRTSVDLGVVGDARETLRLVLLQVTPRDDRGFLAKVLAEHDSWTERQQHLVDPGYDSTRLGKTQASRR
jgi:pyruvate dehydrogenase (quinone)